MLASYKKRVYETIVDQLNEFFLNSEVKPGDKLPTERELASQFKVSRTSIREALHLLAMSGIIEVRQGGGSFVKTTEFQLLHGKLSATLIKAEKNHVYEMLEVRRALEVECASLAAKRATSQDLEKLREALDQMEQAKNDVELGLKADFDFHMMIVNATQNSIFMGLVQTIRENMKDTIRATRKHRLSNPERHEDTMNEHKEIYLAIASGNSNQAKKLMEEHITRVRKELSEMLLP